MKAKYLKNVFENIIEEALEWNKVLFEEKIIDEKTYKHNRKMLMSISLGG